MSVTPKVVTRELDGTRVHVIDGLFDPAIVMMFERMIVGLPFWRSNYDYAESEEARHLRHDFNPETVEKFPLLRGFRDTVTGWLRQEHADRAEAIEQFYALDQYFGAVQFPHQDTVGGMTALYFANSQWPVDWQGETVFYDAAGEACLAVAPKPGRLCVFPGEL